MIRNTDLDDDRKGPAPDEDAEIHFEDKRRWAQADDEDGGEPSSAEEEPASSEPAMPTVLDEFRNRAESAERKLQEYIEAFKTFKDDQESFRLRLQRDVERRVDLKFGEVAADLLESMDDLDLALDHVDGSADGTALAEGVRIARKRFLASLEKHGVERVDPRGEPFDPNLAEAIRMDPVEDADQDGTVTEVLRPGYRLGDRIIRAARVAVGRATGS